jgi:pyruvate-formate lyase-activating enzyme
VKRPDPRGYGQRRSKAADRFRGAAPVAEPRRAAAGIPDDAPVEAIVRLQVACNQHCFFCNTDSRAENLHESPERVYRYLEENRHCLYLSFSGGEPTINPQILRYVRYAKELGIPRIVIQTNGLMVSYPEFADRIVEAGLTGAFMSFHAPTADVSDRITASPGTWALTVRGIRNLLDRGIEVELNTVINTVNYACLGDHARFIVREFPEITAISLSYIAPTGFCVVSEQTIPRVRDVQPHLFEALDVLSAAGIHANVPERCGIPLCTVRGYERHHEAVQPGPFAGTGIVTDDHAKREDCNRCFWNTRCIGHWKAVVDLYGWDDFQPVLEPVEVVALPIPYRGATPELVEEFMRREAARLKKTAPPPG